MKKSILRCAGFGITHTSVEKGQINCRPEKPLRPFYVTVATGDKILIMCFFGKKKKIIQIDDDVRRPQFSKSSSHEQILEDYQILIKKY